MLIWKQLKGGVFDLYEIIPGFLISTLFIVLVSLLNKNPPNEDTNLFDQASD